MEEYFFKYSPKKRGSGNCLYYSPYFFAENFSGFFIDSFIGFNQAIYCHSIPICCIICISIQQYAMPKHNLYFIAEFAVKLHNNSPFLYLSRGIFYPPQTAASRIYKRYKQLAPHMACIVRIANHAIERGRTLNFLVMIQSSSNIVFSSLLFIPYYTIYFIICQ